MMNTRKMLKIGKPAFFARSFAIAASIFVCLGTNASFASENESAAENASKEAWKPMGHGYMARRKLPKKFARAKAERKLARVQERISRTKQQSRRLNKEGNANNVNRASLQKRIDRLQSRKKVLLRKAAKQGGKSVWVHTSDEGLVSLPVADLANSLGLNEQAVRRSASTKKLSMTNRNRAVRWMYFPDTDSVLFVAEKYDTFHTENNAYRLSVGRTDKTARIGISRRNVGPNSGIESPFTETLKFEEEPDMFYSLWSVAEEEDADYWFWEYLYGGYKDAIELDLDIPNPAASGQAQLRVQMRGWTELYDGDEHTVYAEVNGVAVGLPITWDGFNPATLVADFDQSLLNANGGNTLTLRNQYNPGTHAGQWLDDIEIDYQRMPTAEGDSLWMHDVNSGNQYVTGFSSEEILVIQNPNTRPVARRDVTIFEESDGSFSVAFVAKKNGLDYLVSALPALQSGDLAADTGKSSVQKKRLADYLIIAPREFTATAEELRDIRKNSYGRVQIAWLDQIYNKFAHGREDPRALTKYINHLKNKHQAVPSTIVIIGKGTIDHKDRMGYSDSFVPVLMSSTPWALTASDDRLLNGEDIAGFAIGRIPITNDAEGLAYLDKVKLYEQSNHAAENEKAVLIADNPDKAGDFHTNSDLMADRLDNEFGFTDIDKQYHPVSGSISANMQISDNWEVGFVSYDGHGSASQLGDGNENFVKADQAELLTNQVLPIFASLTCAAGDFSVPGVSSVAASLVLNPNGGAVAAYSPSGLSLDEEAQTMGNAFIDTLLGDKLSMGHAVLETKNRTAADTGKFMRRMYSVIGDPAVSAK